MKSTPLLQDQGGLSSTSTAVSAPARLLSASDNEGASSDSAGKNDLCRVCHGPPTRDSPLLSPCRCRGSVRWVHRFCLDHWRLQAPLGAGRCELCGFLYKYQLRRMSFREAALQLLSSGVGAVFPLIATGILLSSATTAFVSLLVMGTALAVWALVDASSTWMNNKRHQLQQQQEALQEEQQDDLQRQPRQQQQQQQQQQQEDYPRRQLQHQQAGSQLPGFMASSLAALRRALLDHMADQDQPQSHGIIRQASLSLMMHLFLPIEMRNGDGQKSLSIAAQAGSSLEDEEQVWQGPAVLPPPPPTAATSGDADASQVCGGRHCMLQAVIFLATPPLLSAAFWVLKHLLGNSLGLFFLLLSLLGLLYWLFVCFLMLAVAYLRPPMCLAVGAGGLPVVRSVTEAELSTESSSKPSQRRA